MDKTIENHLASKDLSRRLVGGRPVLGLCSGGCSWESTTGSRESNGIIFK